MAYYGELNRTWNVHIDKCIAAVRAELAEKTNTSKARLDGIQDASDAIMRIFATAGIDEALAQELIARQRALRQEMDSASNLAAELKERAGGLFNPTDNLDGRALEAVYMTQALVRTFKEAIPTGRGEMDSSVAREMLRSVSYIVWATQTGQAALPNEQEGASNGTND